MSIKTVRAGKNDYDEQMAKIEEFFVCEKTSK